MSELGTSVVDGQPVIIKNKIIYGYYDKTTQAYDIGVADYNDLTEEEQLDGAIRFIQGVDAPQANNSVWNKLGTTPLTTGLPEDCSQAINQLNASLVDLKSNIKNRLNLTLIRNLGTWNYGASYPISNDDWDKYTEFHIFASHNVNSDYYYHLVLYKDFFNHSMIEGYGASGACYVLFAGNSTNKTITLSDAKISGSNYNPNVVLFGR